MNSKSFKTEAEYTSPALKVYYVKLKEIIATSYNDWSDANKAGNLYNGNEYDLDD